MALVDSKVSISFVPLLKDICSALEIGEPHYESSGMCGGTVSVCVALPRSRIQHMFHGFGVPTQEECYEMAARRMAVFLVQWYKIMVFDVSLALRAPNEHCAQMYEFKCDCLRRVEQNLPAASMYEVTPVEGLDYGAKHINMDFMATLHKVLDKYQINVTPITVSPVFPGAYQAWFSIPIPGSISPSHGIMGYKATTIDAAKQTLAREALTLMSMWYRFEVQDVNYYLLNHSSHFMEANRGIYERLMERVHGIKECKDVVPYVVEPDCMTPRGKRSRIPEMQQPPPPPKRARLSYADPELSDGALSASHSSDTFSL